MQNMNVTLLQYLRVENTLKSQVTDTALIHILNVVCSKLKELLVVAALQCWSHRVSFTSGLAGRSYRPGGEQRRRPPPPVET
jgi:hypothetical protein